MKNEILEILTSSSEYVSGQSLAQSLGVTRQAVWKEINALKKRGFKIESVPNRGYRLSSMPGYLVAAAVKREMRTAVIGSELIVLDSVGSTNDYLKQLGNGGCKNGTVVAAREQVGGKGRLGRGWTSVKDENVMFSVLLRPKMAPSEVSCVTPLTGLAVCKALRELTGLDCRIKWPNDVIVGSKKLVGILTEMSAEFDAVEYIVIGTGINVNQTEFPDEIADKATSIKLESGKEFDKNKLLAAVLNQMEQEFIKSDLEFTGETLKEYTELCATVGKTVGFYRGGNRLSGTASGVAENGELMVTLPDGSEIRINSGEVTAQGIY